MSEKILAKAAGVQEAKEIFKEMVKKADIVIENYRLGTWKNLV